VRIAYLELFGLSLAEAGSERSRRLWVRGGFPDSLLARRLRPWASNEGKRLVRSPKVYVRDSGIAHALLNLTTFDHIITHPVVGSSWEGCVIENLLSVAPPGT
jgi:predicted AAA+ superfamily ATPase